MSLTIALSLVIWLSALFAIHPRARPAGLGGLPRRPAARARTVMLALLACAPLSIAHASFIVNTDLDEDVDNDGTCSLREAITAVNMQIDYHDCTSAVQPESSVLFAIPPNTGELHTIELASALPTITRFIGIDATQQSGTTCTPLPHVRVQITNPLQLVADGLVLDTLSDNSVVGGLAFSGFAADFSAGLRINTNNVVVGCVLSGTDAGGSVAQPNYYGIKVDNGAQNATIGVADASAWLPNLISGNTFANIFINAGGSDSLISANYIGVDNSGVNALESGYGIYVQAATGVHIGVGFRDGPAEHQRNIIGVASPALTSSANIELDNTTDSVVAGNYVGVGVDGHTVLPMTTGTAISVTQASGTLIGCNGNSSWETCRNVIVNPTGLGIVVYQGSTGTAVVSNFIGIAADGVTVIPGTANAAGVDLSGGDALVARNLISTGAGVAISLNPNSLNATPVFLNQTPAGNGGAILDSSDNCVQDNTNGGVFTNSNGGAAAATSTTFLNNWWGASDGPAPGGSGTFASNNVITAPFLTAPSPYCSLLDRIFVQGFE